jgi:multidrug efflux pump subunit AcrA (membrane-fusion protein)
MKLPILGLAIGLAASGCKERQYVVEETVGPVFSAKHGLLLPEETRRSIDLQIVEVGEQKGNRALDFEVRVYAQEGNLARASGGLGTVQAGTLKAGQAVEIRSIDGGRPGTASPATNDGSRGTASPTFGKVVGVSDHLRAATGQVEALVEFPVRPPSIAIGTVMSARIALPDGDTVVTIPTSALLQCTEGDFVYTVSGDHFVRTAVKPGAIHGELAEISDGLLSGDQVVAKPVMALWLTELAAVKGGQACCIEPPKGK